MIIAVCIDDQGGMLFNRRRQSQDRLLRADLLREAAGRTLWMSAYSAGQFQPLPENIRVAEDFAAQAEAGSLCFFEDVDPAPYLGEAEKVLLYRWNRRYPADRWFRLPAEGWRLERSEDFPGSSHEQITKEVYCR